MTGRLRDYNLFVMLYVVLVVGGTIFFKDALRINIDSFSPVAAYEVILGIVLAGATIGVVFAKGRLAATVSLGVAGFMVAFFFALFRAPDLVLTQLIIETVTLALLLMAFSRLPKYLDESSTPATTKITNGVVAISVGVMAALLTMIGHSSRFYESIAYYFIENSYEFGGGTNAVNVVLVDFRGLDTLGEAVVLGIAGLGVYAMIKLALGKGGKTHEDG
jgi:multicomponent Na+:H+ antiporter subunit A